MFEECPSNPASVYYMGNFNTNNNPYSNTYNPGRKQQPNFRTQGTLPTDTENARPYGKECCKAITLKSGTQLDRVDKSVVVKKMNSESDQRTTLEQHKKSTTNEKIGPNNAKENSDSTNEHNAQAKKPLQLEVHPSPPFPQQFQNHRQDQQLRRFLDVLNQLHSNIPLVEALEQMSNYVKFMKDILSRKR
ncbi:Integrase, catalytic core [Gossypium australe]|uniref:Integrase, catalytic core n=1 Tax=Gossypium australe TaxID=47621 RepID=A0A5B6VAZ0_9ROSI|nr:Integrase, catalytic core [Gossypium australe]